MKIFISQPMRGRTQEDILRDRAKIKEYAIRKYGNDVVFLESHLDMSETSSPLKLLGRSIETMADADLCIFSPGWLSARGCVIENNCASMYGIPTITMTKLLDYDLHQERRQ